MREGPETSAQPDTSQVDGRAGAFTTVPPCCPVPLLAESADFTLAAPPLAAAARQASQDVASAPRRPWGSLPALSGPVEGLRGLGQGQPLAGGHCLIQITLRVSVHIWKGIFCKR